jgi:pimeloyl-ACP methyl ester carboxylesterase
MTNSKTIVFIHGLFMNPSSWGNWIEYFQNLGYTCYAPAFPYHDGRPANLRNDINPELNKVTISDVVKSYVEFIDTLPEMPILVGHSVGGFIVQKLIELEKGIKGVCIDAAPPAGVFTFKWSFWRANLPVINPFKGNSAFVPSVQWFQKAFCNTMSLEETKKIYDLYVVPESRNIPRSMLNDPYGKIDFDKAHAPLLFISGEKDSIIPYTLNISNIKAYNDTKSIREHKIFAGRTHYICGQEGWEEVANFAAKWL